MEWVSLLLYCPKVLSLCSPIHAGCLQTTFPALSPIKLTDPHSSPKRPLFQGTIDASPPDICFCFSSELVYAFYFIFVCCPRKTWLLQRLLQNSKVFLDLPNYLHSFLYTAHLLLPLPRAYSFWLDLQPVFCPSLFPLIAKIRTFISAQVAGN